MWMASARTLCLAFALVWPSFAVAEIAVPPLTGRITDLTSTLSADQKSALEQKLQAFEARKGSQLAVLLVPTTAPETIEQYALRVAEKWRLGRKKVDDGAILLIAKDDRALRIEVGYGLEGALSDATSKRIISETITPRFKQGDFAGGIDAGVDQLIRVVDGEALPAPPATAKTAARGGSDFGQMIPIVLILALTVGGVLRAMLGRFPGALVTGGAVGAVTWMLAGTVVIAVIAGVIALIFTLLSGGMGGFGRGGLGRGGFGGGFGGGGGGFGGGGGGGGFSGGGGSFGGGGASGRW